MNNVIITRSRRLNIPSTPRTGLPAALSWIAMAVVVVAFLAPLAWMIFASFDPSATFVTKLPRHASLGNYKAILTPEMSLKPLANSLFISISVTIIVLICSVLVAYPISRYHSRFNKPFMVVILFGTCLPITAIMVPVYALFVSLNLLDNTFGLILFMSAAGLPMAVWLTKSYMDGVPVEIEEAAWVDGASLLKTIWSVVVPLMRPGLCVVAIFVFMGSWGDFFTPYILLLDPNKLPASVAIFNFFGQHGSIIYGQLAAFAVLYSLPPVIMYAISSHFVGGTYSMAGGVKG